MTSIEEIRDMISTSLDEEEENRERTYSLSRDLIRTCRRFISDVHNGEKVLEADLIDESMELIDLYQDPRCQRFKFIDDSLTELSEAIIFLRMINDEELPTPHEINVNERSYLLGACDAIGEMRRVVLNHLLKEELNDAMRIFDRMADVSHLVQGLSYPSGMIPLKKKQDVVRALMDRTAGEITFAKYSPINK
jgi:translin